MLPNRAECQMPQVERLLSQACPRPFLQMSSAGPGCHLCVLRNHPRPPPRDWLIHWSGSQISGKKKIVLTRFPFHYKRIQLRNHQGHQGRGMREGARRFHPQGVPLFHILTNLEGLWTPHLGASLNGGFTWQARLIKSLTAGHNWAARWQLPQRSER